MIIEKKDYTKYLLALIPSAIITLLNVNIVNLTMSRKIINLTLKGKTKNLVEVYPMAIKVIKVIYHPLVFLSLFILSIIVINFVHIQLPKKEKKEKPVLYPENIPYDQESKEFELHIGAIHNERNLDITAYPKLCTIKHKNIFKNFVIFGVIGEGKTASALLPILQQIIYYQARNSKQKIGGFITDVKGNFAQYVVKYAKDVGRDDDIVLFRICGDFYYNFLYKPDEPASVLASRLVEYLKVHNQSGNEGYWIDQAKRTLENGIKLLRLANEDEYITFEDLDRVIADDERRALIIENLMHVYNAGKMTKYQRELFESAKLYFEKKYINLSLNVRGIIESEVSRIVDSFTSDPVVKHTFCPPKDKLNFPGFRTIIEEGKIFIFDIPNERFKGVAEMACAFAKLDYQSMILQRMSNKEYNQSRISFFMSDENHFIVTPNDTYFYSLGREAMNFSIVVAQSKSSYMTVLKNKDLVNSMLNNLDNKIIMRNTDPDTLDYVLKVFGKEVKTYQNRSTSESGKSDIDYFASNVSQNNKSISQSISEVERREEVFTQEFFSRVLDEFKCIGLVNSGKTLAPIHLFKYWENTVVKDYPLKKATPSKEFIYKDYPTMQEMINKVNDTDVFISYNNNIDRNENGNVFILDGKDKEQLEKATRNKDIKVEANRDQEDHKEDSKNVRKEDSLLDVF